MDMVDIFLLVAFFIGFIISLVVLFSKVRKNENKKKPLICSIVFIVFFMIGIMANFGDSAPIYKNAKIEPVYNGVMTEKIGEYSICKASSEECTDEAVGDWYFNYVKEHDYNWCMILYTDKSDSSGIYAINGMVVKDVKFAKDDNGSYYVEEMSGHPMYSIDSKNETLKL